MTSLELSQEEARELSEVLDSALSELRMEIADTDRKDFRDMLKERKEFLQELLVRLRE